MNNKKKNTFRFRFKGQLRAYLVWPIFMSILLATITGAIYFVSIEAGFIMTGFFALYLTLALILYFHNRPQVMSELMDFTSEYSTIQKKLLHELAVPYGIVDMDGKILWMNEEFAELMGKDSLAKGKSITSIIPAITEEELELTQDRKDIHTVYEGMDYHIELKKVDVKDTFSNSAIFTLEDESDYLIAVYLFDETKIKKLQKENADQKLVAGLIYIDNYEEALESVEDVRRSLLVALIDRKVNKYISGMNGIVKKVEKDKYFIAIMQKYVEVLQASKFSIIDEVKTVNIGNEMDVTISIGLGVNGESYSQNCDYSRTAIDLALGRGGDQAVIKDGDKIYYYGGKTKQVEKNTRVKARVKAHALRELLETKDKVIIMGHKIGDVDSFGAGIGLYRAVKSIEKKAHIVINEITSTVRPMMEQFSNNPEYEENMFVTSNQALELLDASTTVIVVDVNRPSYTECPELITTCKSIVVLDHHRQGTESIDNAVLSYIEPFASSTCEMVSEILQYISDGIKLKPAEADAVYAGVMIDTNNFTQKTGVRTFEAAAFLRRNGADVTKVRMMLRDKFEDYKVRAESIGNARMFGEMFAITRCPSKNIESPTVIGAQVANELLNVNGIKASFVITPYNEKMYVSARSIDEFNVQLVMERLGGGGHMNVAGAQLENCTVEEAEKIVQDTVIEMINEKEI